MKRLVVLVMVLVLSCGQRVREVKRSGEAFGSYVLIRVQGRDEQRLNQAVDSVLGMFCRFNRLWSVYSESSEISVLNRQCRVRVSPETRELILQAVEFCRRTGGVFDIKVGPLMRLWGFRRGD
jgi:thiamine biosynthesis lipoprotein